MVLDCQILSLMISWWVLKFTFTVVWEFFTWILVVGRLDVKFLTVFINEIVAV